MHAKAVLNKDGSSRSDLQILSDQDWQDICGTDSWNEIRKIQHPRTNVTSFGKDGSRLR